jgi:hypothetical protein
MSPKRQTAFRLDPELLEALMAIKEREGISLTGQVNRALRAWVQAKGMSTKTDRKRAATRKRS